MNKLVKLHLGCYHRKIHGFINIDIRDDVNADLVEDCFTLPSFQERSVDLIYSCHMLEHCKKSEVSNILKRWFDILKWEGILRLSVPDIEALCRYYINTKDLSAVSNLFYGSQKHPYDFHYIGFDFDYLSKLLKEAGFDSIKKYDWRDTEHFYIDDYSQCYLPNISYKSRRKEDTINGNLVSLNIEATKTSISLIS